MTKYRKIMGCALLVLLAGTLGLGLERATRIDRRALVMDSCVFITDRHGAGLRLVPDRTGARHLQVPLEAIPEHLVNAFLAAEDRHFWNHPGIDPPAIVRAVLDNLTAGRIVSGASTITQQVIRLFHPAKRSYANKVLEMIRALRLERQLGKNQILALYLNRVPLGNQLQGVETAARIYFGKSCRDLNVAEAALLASLPKAPSRLNPYGPHRHRLLRRKDWVLTRMRDNGFLSAAEFRENRSAPVHFQEKNFPFAAPHLVDRLLAEENQTAHTDPSGDRIVATTIDLELQHQVEQILASHEARLRHRGARQAAVVVLDNVTGSVLALAGSIRYGERFQGFNNGACALRSPGSALKPFLYAQAIDSGFTATSILDDVSRDYAFAGGIYLPANYDRRTYGPVTLRDALANSFNLAAVHLLNRIGCDPFYGLLQRLGLINFPERGAGYYGLGMVVGNPEVTLLQLASAYACLANGGRFRPAHYRAGVAPKEPVRVFSEQAAFIVTDILSDPSSRAITFARARSMNPPYRVAMKTGTSSKYRDGWIVGITPQHTVGVWVGNFDGRPTVGLSGSSGAAPILGDIFERLYRLGPPPAFSPPAGLVRTEVCATSGMKPSARCRQRSEDWFVAGTEPKVPCSYHQKSAIHHDLPTRFAGWLHQRQILGNGGRYRIAGLEDAPPSTWADDAPIFSNRPSAVAPEANPIVIGRPVPETGSGDPAKSRSEPSNAFITITEPLDGSRLILDRSRTGQWLVFRAAVDRPVPHITWLVDDSRPVTVGPPYSWQWPLSPGRHTILAETPGHRSDQIEIVVE